MPARKRSAPEPVANRRRSGRLSNTSKKSSYFEDNESDADEDGLPPKKRRGRPSKRESPAKEDSEEQYEEESTEDAEEENEDEDDEDAPRKVEIIPLVKMRDTGGVEYEDHRLHKNTLLFLKDLKANNKRPWLKCELPWPDKETQRR